MNIDKKHGRLALLMLAASLVWTGAMAQQNAAGNASRAAPAAASSAASSAMPATPATCPTRADALPGQALYGRWEVTFDGSGSDRTASVVLHKHPDYEGGVRGTITRAGHVAQLAGDIGDDGLLTLDESQDGIAISASWSGELQAGSCGREFKGIWRDARDDSTLDFVLRKIVDEN